MSIYAVIHRRCLQNKIFSQKKNLYIFFVTKKLKQVTLKKEIIKHICLLLLYRIYASLKINILKNNLEIFLLK